ncbi:amidase family protein [Streptomyces sp. NPDC055078]
MTKPPTNRTTPLTPLTPLNQANPPNPMSRANSITPPEVARQAERLGLPLTGRETADVVRLAGRILDVVGDLPAPPAPPRPGGVREILAPPTGDDDPLNAITHWTDVHSAGHGPLHGKRIVVKDSIAVAGVPMSAGSALLNGFVPERDSVVAGRLLDAGARIVATTAMDEFGLSAGGDSRPGTTVRNPYDPARSAGGSSSGCAAALQYDTVDIAIGADQGGSVRVPASWCGVLGLKPTHGLVPCTGTVGIDRTVDHLGPLARTVADLAAVLQVIAGPDDSDSAGDDTAGPESAGARTSAVPDYPAAVAEAPADLTGVRIGLVREALADGSGVDPVVARATRTTAAELRGLGATVRDVDLPEHASAGPLCFGTTVEGWSALLDSGGNGYQWSGRYWPELARAISDNWEKEAEHLGVAAKAVLVAGAYLREHHRGARYATAQNLRSVLVDGYRRALSGVDFLLMPTTPGLPHPVAAGMPEAERVLRGWDVLANTAQTNLTGHPALSLPLAEADGLPIGMMLVGHPHADADLLRCAATIERGLGWVPAAR